MHKKIYFIKDLLSNSENKNQLLYSNKTIKLDFINLSYILLISSIIKICKTDNKDFTIIHQSRSTLCN